MIKKMFNDIYKEEADPKYKVTEDYSDKDIELADTLH